MYCTSIKSNQPNPIRIRIRIAGTHLCAFTLHALYVSTLHVCYAVAGCAIDQVCNMCFANAVALLYTLPTMGHVYIRVGLFAISDPSVYM